MVTQRGSREEVEEQVSVDLVVVGLGYVGLPLVREACRAGLRVVGLDASADVVDDLNAGRSHVDDLTEDDLAAMLQSEFVATTSDAVIGDSETVVICVPTPLDGDGGPDLTALRAAATSVASHMHPGMLVVLESTTYPGTTDEVIRPILESSGMRAGTDFALAFSPERIDPGNPTFGLRNTPKVVGANSDQCAQRAEEFYGKLCEQVVHTRGTREAEMAKLLENTYRHVNIALVNEMAIFCHELGIDLRDSISAAATKPFGFQAFYPGPGVGGHCIPIDPNYLSYKVRSLGYPFRFVELAQEINQRMPAYVAQRVQEILNDRRKPVNGSQVLILGVTYKPNIADQRESPARPVARRLRRLGADLVFHDPYVETWEVDGVAVPRADDLATMLQSAAVSVLLQNHSAYDDRTLEQAGLLLDTRGVIGDPGAEVL